MSKGGRPRLYSEDDEEVRVVLPAWVCRHLRRFGEREDLTEPQLARRMVVEAVNHRLRREVATT